MLTSTYFPSRRAAIGGILGGLSGFPLTLIAQTSVHENIPKAKTMTLSEQLLHSTVQIICETTPGNIVIAHVPTFAGEMAYRAPAIFS
jgi:hypothetical protein